MEIGSIISAINNLGVSADEKRQEIIDLLKNGKNDLNAENLNLLKEEVINSAKKGNYQFGDELIDLVDLKNREKFAFIASILADLAEDSTSTASLLLKSLKLTRAETQRALLEAIFLLQKRSLDKAVEDMVRNSDLSSEQKQAILRK